jgi:hypothetical protein
VRRIVVVRVCLLYSFKLLRGVRGMEEGYEAAAAEEQYNFYKKQFSAQVTNTQQYCQIRIIRIAD